MKRNAWCRLGQLLVILAAGPLHGANNAGLQTTRLTINNNTQSGKDLYISIVGEIGSTWYSVTDLQGDVAPSTYSPKPVELAIDLGTAPKVEMKMPQLIGMRIYFSVGKPLYVNTAADGTPGAPAGWVPGDTNFNTVFDWAELTWVIDPNSGLSALGGNVTQVDMFGLAMKIAFSGLAGDLKTPVTYSSGFDAAAGTSQRKQIFTDIAKAGAPWKALIMRDPDNKILRVISPYHGIENHLVPADQLQPYINRVFAHYKKGGLSGQSEGVTFTGRTSGTELVFTDTQSGETFQFPQPTTYSTYTGAFAPVPVPGDPILARRALAIGALLQGAFMRSDLVTDANLNACATKEFYQRTPVDQYARIIHKYALDHLAYAFGFDDTCSQSSYIGVYTPKSVAITIGPL